MIIREATLDDLDEIERISISTLEGERWTKEAFIPDFENDVASIMCLCDDDEVIGYYDIWQIFENVDIVTIAIDKKYQGKGLGTYLLKDLVKRCIKKNVEFIHLEVRVSNIRAINLYKKFGFEEVRKRKSYYSNGEDAIDMVKGIVGLSEKDFSD